MLSIALFHIQISVKIIKFFDIFGVYILFLILDFLQDANQDTQWNDALRKHGIIPQKKEAEVTEDQIVNLIDQAASKHSNGQSNIADLGLDELDLLEDEEDERILLEYRNKRIAEIKALMAKSKFGDVKEISAPEYKEEVNNAGEEVWVVLHLYQHRYLYSINGKRIF